MNKKVTIELTQEEYDALCKFWEAAKNSPIMPSKALNIDDFCKEIITNCTKTPDLSNMDELVSSLGELGNLENLKDLLGNFGKKKPEPKKEEPKKDDVPDDQKYKS